MSPTPTALTVYETTHVISQTVCRAFAAGARAPIQPAHKHRGGGTAAFYGILRGTGDIFRARLAAGQPFLYIDHGYLARGHFDGHYRVVPNALHLPPSLLDRESDGKRWERLNINLHPWRKGGAEVVIAVPSAHIGRFGGFEPYEWAMSVRNELLDHTDREIVFSRKGDGKSGLQWLETAHAVVTMQSNLALEALRLGVPAFVVPANGLTHPAAALTSDHLHNIETPIRRSRTWLFRALADWQWTLREMRSGACIGVLRERLEDLR